MPDDSSYRLQRLRRSIIIAEGASTAVALGSVIAVQNMPGLLLPLRDWTARRLVAPYLPKAPQEDEAHYRKRLEDQAALVTKGGVLVGASIASHVPIQLALGNGFNMREGALALAGKSAGLAVSMGAIYAASKLFPQTFTRLDDASGRHLSFLVPKGNDHGHEAARELGRLILLDVPSSVISSLINYRVTRGHM